jgi:hypothetical protein
MSDKSQDAGVLYVLVERFNTQRLPRALDLKARIDAGGTLTDLDIHFLEDVFADAKAMAPLIEKHPEYKELAGRAMSLYRQILEKAAENEAKAG